MQLQVKVKFYSNVNEHPIIDSESSPHCACVMKATAVHAGSCMVNSTS